jgi:membrane protein
MNEKAADAIARIKRFLKYDLWNTEPDSLSKVRRRGLKFLRVCALVVKGFKEDKCPLHAAALTFIFVMALVPFLVILFAIAKGIGFEEGSSLLLEAVADMPEAIQQAVGNVLNIVESASAGTLGSIGTVLFLWIAIKMLSNIEETFNLVWGVKTSRTLIDKIRNYIVIIVIVPVLLIVANAGQPLIMSLTGRLEWMGPLLKIGLQLVPVLTAALAFTVFYLFMPNTKVRIGPAFSGALTAALLAQLFQLAIIELGVGVSRYNATYGALAAIPIFLFWVQINWMILLMGAEVAFSVQNAGTYARERIAVTPSPRARLCLAFALMKKIAESFENNAGPFDTLAYGAEKRIPVRLVNDVINILARGGLVAEAADRQGCYTLLRDPSHISARDVADAVLNDGADPHELGMSAEFPLLETLTDESFRSLEKRTLRQF